MNISENSSNKLGVLPRDRCSWYEFKNFELISFPRGRFPENWRSSLAISIDLLDTNFCSSVLIENYTVLVKMQRSKKNTIGGPEIR